MKKYEINLSGKRVMIEISKTAQEQLKNSKQPLLLEMELYFSCLIKKICHFRSAENTDGYVRVMDDLYIHFRASMTNRCSIEEFDKEKTADFPIDDRSHIYLNGWILIIPAMAGQENLVTRSRP